MNKIQYALKENNYYVLKNLDKINPIDKSQLMLNNSLEYIKYCPVTKKGIKIIMYDILENVNNQYDAIKLIDELYEMKQENMIKLFNNKRFVSNFKEALIWGFDETTTEIVNEFLEYTLDVIKRSNNNV